MPESVNVCCPFLTVADCADTEEHKHLVCTDSNAVISNDTVRELCLGDYSKCVVNKE